MYAEKISGEGQKHIQMELGDLFLEVLLHCRQHQVLDRAWGGPLLGRLLTFERSR